jgi:hypothetical protein
VAGDVDLRGIGIGDVAPSLLHALGLPVAADFTGRPWGVLLRDERPVETLESWGRRDPVGEGDGHVTDEEELRQLRALGYIE